MQFICASCTVRMKPMQGLAVRTMGCFNQPFKRLYTNAYAKKTIARYLDLILSLNIQYKKKLE